MKSLIVRMLVGAGLVMLTAVPVHAQGWGLRGGANVNPDQVFFGASYEVGPLVENLWLQPSGDLGFGNGVTLFAVNIDLMYRLWQPRTGPWRLDVGGGPGINHYRFDTHADTEAGFNAVVALLHSNGWGSEFRIGFLDSPDVRVAVTYRLGQRNTTPRK